MIANPGTGGALPYQYNLAELAWLQRHLLDNPTLPPKLAALEGQFFFLGGGITSPDNLVCNGEAFIRNYLVGRAFANQIWLGGLLTDVCWIPDDFGQDPQLPVVLTAMGMNGVSFWRVPGNEPPPPSYAPTDPNVSAWSSQLKDQGVTLLWQAADGSTILTQQMSDGYGVIWDQESSAASSLVSFVQPGAVQPGNLFLAPCGGDFSQPSANLLAAVNQFNQDSSQNQGVTAVMGTFQNFIDAMNAYNAANPGTLKTITDFDASNFWTGCFASRVELKINQQRSVNRLMAAETLSTLLRGQANLSGSVLDGLERLIEAAWENLIPSTHHDYVTGAAPDQTYWMEQEPLSALALAQSFAAAREAMARLGEVVKAAPNVGEIPYAVFNPSGFARQIGSVVEIPARPELAGMNSFRLAGGSTTARLQILENGNMLLPYPDLGSTGYGCVYLSKAAVAPAPPPASFTFSNGVIQITVVQSGGWVIQSIQDLENGGTEILTAGPGNHTSVYYEQNADKTEALGNLYEMGSEWEPASPTGGFFTDNTSAFEALDGTMVESGPYRWHFAGTIHNEANDLTLKVEYFLEYNEPLVRMRVTGQAATAATSLVTSWKLQDGSGNPPAGMSYGTANHWNGPAFTPYWQGPTFRSTHDYITLLEQGNDTGNPLAAVYHEGMRAWAFDGQQLMGILFRNPPAIQRGAAGTDTATHVQNYALRIPGVGSAATCQPLPTA